MERVSDGRFARLANRTYVRYNHLGPRPGGGQGGRRRILARADVDGHAVLCALVGASVHTGARLRGGAAESAGGAAGGVDDGLCRGQRDRLSWRCLCAGVLVASAKRDVPPRVPLVQRTIKVRRAVPGAVAESRRRHVLRARGAGDSDRRDRGRSGGSGARVPLPPAHGRYRGSLVVVSSRRRGGAGHAPL